MTAMQTRMAATPATTPPTIDAALLEDVTFSETFNSQSIEMLDAFEMLDALAVLPSGRSEHVEARAAEYLPAPQGLQSPRPR